MSDFSSNDINDAKRRVEEMRRRARDAVASSNNDEKDTTTLIENHNDNTNKSFGLGSILSSFGIDSVGGDSSLILALILILSREGADNMLILALLYILL